MLTLDALAKMARRMGDEAAKDGAYRHPDGGLRTREVDLPPPEEEVRRARGLFGLAVGLSALVLTPTGVIAIHGAELFAGQAPDPAGLLRTGAWFLVASLGLIAPFAAFGLWREVRRYRRVRREIGPRGVLDASGVLRSEDGSRSWPLR